MFDRLCFCLFFALCAVAAADEVADFAAFPDPEADRRSQFMDEAKQKMKSDSIREYIEDWVKDMEDVKPDAPWRERLDAFLPCDRHEDDGTPLTQYNYNIIKAYQKKHSVPDKEIRDGLHDILVNCKGYKDEPPFSKCYRGNFLYYTGVLQYYGDATTLPILAKIMDKVPDLAERACEAYIAITRGELDDNLWRYFTADDDKSRDMRFAMVSRMEISVIDPNRSNEERQVFLKALLRLYYLCDCDYGIGRYLLSCRYYDIRFLRSYKSRLILLAKTENNRAAIIELKLPRWGKIKCQPRLEEWFQEIVKQPTPPKPSRNLPPPGWKGSDFSKLKAQDSPLKPSDFAKHSEK